MLSSLLCACGCWKVFSINNETGEVCGIGDLVFIRIITKYSYHLEYYSIAFRCNQKMSPSVILRLWFVSGRSLEVI